MYPSLSVCMIVKNEEKNLPRVLQSIKGLADEIIVVDTGSRDETINVAKSFGAKVFPFEWRDDFSEARNESLRHATKDYILWLDADDEVERKEHERIKRDLRKRKGHALFLHVRNLQEEGITECIQLRIFPNIKGVKFEGRIHEQVYFSLARLRIPMSTSDATIIHHGYKEKKVREEKLKRNRIILQEEISQNPGNLMATFFLSRTLIGSEEFDQAEKYIDHLLNMLKREDSLRELGISTTIVLDKANLLCKKGKIDEALSFLLEWKESLRKSDLLSFTLGELYFKKGEYERAYEILYPLYGKSLNNELLPVNLERLKYNLTYYLGISALFVKDYALSKKSFNELIKVEPENPANYHYLSLCEERAGNLKGAIDILREAERRFEGERSFIKRRFVLELEKKDFEEAERDLFIMDGEEEPEIIAGAFYLMCERLDLKGIEKYYSDLRRVLSLPFQSFPEGLQEIEKTLKERRERKALFFFENAISDLLRLEKGNP